MYLSQLDHLVLTVRDINTSVEFYTNILGMEKIVFGKNRIALKFGQQKINLHEYKNEFEPKSLLPTPGSADLCFITETDINAVINELEDAGVEIETGPVERTGATGKINSIYIRDPDKNLLEIANQL